MRGRNGGPSTRELVGEIGSQLVQLAQAEVELARAELASNVRSGRRALVGLGVATVAALVGVTLLLVSGVLGLAMLVPGRTDRGGGRARGGGRGRLHGLAATPPLTAGPHAEIPKEDWEWLKQRVG
jgi:hypothetical protein